MNSKTSADVVSGVKRDTDNCFLYGTTESLYLPPPAIWTPFVWLSEQKNPLCLNT